MARQPISPEIKAAALADLATGEQPAVVADRYGINRQTVKAWRARLQPELQPPMQPELQPVRMVAVEQRQETLAELVEANLRAKLTATQRLAEHVTRDDWLNKQNASDVAELFAVIDRSAIGILDRLAGAQRPPSSEDG